MVKCGVSLILEEWIIADLMAVAIVRDTSALLPCVLGVANIGSGIMFG